MDKYFVHYESRSSLISDYLSGFIKHTTHPVEDLETCQKYNQGQKFHFFPTLETCWLNPQSHQSLFDLQGYKVEELPGYEQAAVSAQRWLKKQTAYRDAQMKDLRFPTQQETSGLQATWLEYLNETSFALFEQPGQTIITDACLALDESLFLEIARVIENRHRRTELDLLDVQTAICWTKCLLWLMSDDDARTFIRMHVRFEKPGDKEIKFEGYKKMRQQMRLYRHPKPLMRISPGTSKLNVEKLRTNRRA